MRTSTALIIAVAIAQGLMAVAARASTTYSYTAQPQGDRIIFGADNTLNVYLQEVTTGGFTVADDGGLSTAGVALWLAPALGASIVGASNNAGASPGGFAGGNNTAGVVGYGLGAWIADALSPTASVGVVPTSTTTTNGTTTNLYLLGTVTIHMYLIPAASLVVESLHDAPAGKQFPNQGLDGNTTTLDHHYDLDGGPSLAPGVTGADGHPTVVPVPEPAALSVFGAGAASLLARRRRR